MRITIAASGSGLVHPGASADEGVLFGAATSDIRRRFTFRTPPTKACGLAGLLLASVAASAFGAQTDIPGPAGSSVFGATTTTLANGNIVVSDPDGQNNAIGAVYLYSPAGVLISTLRGHAKNDRVGSGGITALSNGNFVVSSPNWDDGVTAGVGAVTWVDGTSGLDALVAAGNSLVGSHANDHVGNGGVTALGNGNFVVTSADWSGPGVASAGAVTWADGTAGIVGVVSDTNSLVGSHAGDHVGNGGVKALTNNNYVVVSSNWTSPTTSGVGAVTWASGGSGITGAVAAANSQVGTHANDHGGNGGVAALSNGNYVAISTTWANGSTANAGAVAWGNGAGGTAGELNDTNSLVGGRAGDQIGVGGVTALTQGNYVVSSRLYDSATAADVGAVTWGNGSTGTHGVVSELNSLVGSTVSDQVGETGVVALPNGNYVVGSRLWDDPPNANVGAVTWGNGTAGIIGPVTLANSLYGPTQGDRVGGGGIVALTNGNYAVSSPLWDAPGIVDAGAVTWGNGNTGTKGAVAPGNSLIGTTLSDQVGLDGITALGNGNYVVCSSLWDDVGNADVGAVTWLDGSGVTSSSVSVSNSLFGTTPGDLAGSGHAIAVGGGNYVAVSPAWANGANAAAGAVTWGAGHGPSSGAITAANSLLGTTAGDQVGSGGVSVLSNGDYAVRSPLWDNVLAVDAGAVTLGRHGGGSTGPIADTNSVRGTTAAGGPSIVFAYDAALDTLVVGQPASNLVSLFKADLLFTNGFE